LHEHAVHGDTGRNAYREPGEPPDDRRCVIDRRPFWKNSSEELAWLFAVEQARPFRTPWVPLVPILGIIFNGYMMYKLGWVNWARLLIWLVIGLVIYFTYSRYHSRVRGAVIK